MNINISNDIDLWQIDIQCCMQMYPTRVRSFALGLNNSMSRVGAIVSPFVSVNMIKSGHLRGAEGVIAGFCIAAAFCICCLPKEKPSRSLEVCP